VIALKPGTTMAITYTMLCAVNFKDMKNRTMTIEQKILDVMKGMEGIGGIPTPEEYFAEFDMRVASALGLVDSAFLPPVSGMFSSEKLEQAYKDGVRDALAKGYGTFDEENYR
jgi:hypothetical protein